MEMKNPLADIPATGSVAPGTTDLERRVASSEHASGGDMGDTGAGDVRVAERHGIWTVSAAGHFAHPFNLPGFDEKLPARAGRAEAETGSARARRSRPSHG